jgi:hypothetical protein
MTQIFHKKAMRTQLRIKQHSLSDMNRAQTLPVSLTELEINIANLRITHRLSICREVWSDQQLIHYYGNVATLGHIRSDNPPFFMTSFEVCG